MASTFAERQALASDLSRLPGGLVVKAREDRETLEVKDPKRARWEDWTVEQARERIGQHPPLPSPRGPVAVSRPRRAVVPGEDAPLPPAATPRATTEPRGISGG